MQPSAMHKKFQQKQQQQSNRASQLNQEDQSETEVNSSSSSSCSSFQQEGFQVIGKQSDNQALVVKLEPDNVLWHKGVALFSSKKCRQKIQFDDIIKKLAESFGWFSFSPKVLANSGTQMAYYILSKEYPYNGKILILSHNIYKENFYINFDHLLTINYDSTQYNIKKHPDMKYLKLVQPTSAQPPLFVTLQSSKDTSIVEKFLAPEESLYLPNATILAMSQNIKCKWQPRYRLFKLSGEGYVFFEPRSQIIRSLTLRNRDMIMVNFLIIAIILVLYLIQYLYLK